MQPVADLLTIAMGVAINKQVLELNGLIKEYCDSPEHLKINRKPPSFHRLEQAVDFLPGRHQTGSGTGIIRRQRQYI